MNHGKSQYANEYWLTSTGFQPLRGLWRHQKVLKGTVSSPVYPKMVSADAASSWSLKESASYTACAWSIN